MPSRDNGRVRSAYLASGLGRLRSLRSAPLLPRPKQSNRELDRCENNASDDNLRACQRLID